VSLGPYLDLLLLVCCSSPTFGSITFGAPPLADEDIMSPKPGGSGTCVANVQENLRWGVDRSLADRIGCHTRMFAEQWGYWTSSGITLEATASALKPGGTITFYDSVTGLPLFVAPRGRTLEAFLEESQHHGWPSFRDEEVVQENVRVLADGETVSVNGTHLGHNLPDGRNRYCIDLVSIAGTASSNATCVGGGTAVYFGNGCFWHTQFDMYSVEIEAPFSRTPETATARTGYAGGSGAGPAGQVCYHGGPSGTFYGVPGGLHHAEAVQVYLDEDRTAAAAQFKALADKYFGETFHRSGGQMIRGDPQDRGADYRNVIGVPGGLAGAFGPAIKASNLYSMPLIEGGPGDSTDEGVVYVYDSNSYPFYRAERYHQYHRNVVIGRSLPSSYMGTARSAAISSGWIDETCGSRDGETSPYKSNVEPSEGACRGGLGSRSAPVSGGWSTGPVVAMVVGALLALALAVYFYKNYCSSASELPMQRLDDEYDAVKASEGHSMTELKVND